MHAMHNGGIPLWAPVSPLCTYVEIHLFTKIQIFQHCEFLELGTFAFFGENQKLQKGMQKFLLPDHFPYLAEVDILLWICDIELEIGSH